LRPVAYCFPLQQWCMLSYLSAPMNFYVSIRACSGNHVWSEVATREARCQVLVNGIFSTECGQPVFPAVQHSYRQTQALLEQMNSYSSLTKYILNTLTPNDTYWGRTAALTSKRCILYIYSNKYRYLIF